METSDGYARHSEFRLSEEAQEAMRGDFILAGETQLAGTPKDCGVSADIVDPTDTLSEAARDFLDTSRPMPLTNQLEFLDPMLRSVGLVLPEPQPAQYDKLNQNLTQLQGLDKDHYRLVPAPLPLEKNLLLGRQAIFANLATQFPAANIDERGLISSIFSAYTQLLENYADCDSMAVLVYKSIESGAKYVTRDIFAKQLDDAGKLIDGWTFNFVDVWPNTRRHVGTAGQLYKSADATYTAETELVTQAIRAAACLPNTSPRLGRVVNEGLAHYRDIGPYTEYLVKEVAIVRWLWNSASNLMELKSWPRDTEGNLLTRRDVVSGL